MAYTFNKNTFGTLRPNLYQSDYINRKKGLITFCKTPSYCNKIKVSSSYNNLNSFNLGRYVRSLEKCNVLPINKSNLIIGQYTKFNTNDICTVSDINNNPQPCSSDHPCNPCQINTPVSIDPTPLVPPINPKPFYYTYQIDPLGELFGKTPCGELNYVNYMNFE